MRHPVDNPRFGGQGSDFGPRTPPAPGASAWHGGQDYPMAEGTPIKAITDGVMESRFTTGPGGNWFYVRRPNGDRYGGCHLRSRALVAPGKRVKEGQVIGYVGSTGTATTGPHLHFVVLVDDEPVDPREYIESGALSVPATPKPPTKRRRKPVDAFYEISDGGLKGRSYRQREDGRIRHVQHPSEKIALEANGAVFVKTSTAAIEAITKTYGSF